MQADVAQLAEQLICNQQVIGSSPIIGFLFLRVNFISRGGAARKLVGLITQRSQVQILPPLFNAQIAQLVEQRTENPRVAGSIPALGILSCKKTMRVSSTEDTLFFIYLFVYSCNDPELLHFPVRVFPQRFQSPTRFCLYGMITCSLQHSLQESR